MRAIWILLRSQARVHWRAWLALGLMLGLGAGGAIAAATGARRSETAFHRFVVAMNTPDMFTGGSTGERDDVAMFEEVEHLPQVADSVRGYTPSQEVILPSGAHAGFPNLRTFLSLDPRAGRTIAGFKLIDGRRAVPSRADEATVSFAALRYGIQLGQVLRIPITNGEGQRIDEGSVRVVGVHASPEDFPSVNGTAFPGVFLTPAFFTAHQQAIESLNPSDVIGVGLILKPGVTPDDVVAEASRRNIPLEFPVVTRDFEEGVQRSIRFEGIALWLLAVFLAIAIIAVIGQALARQTYIEATDNPVLHALGATVSQLFVVNLARAALVGIVGAVTSVAVGIAASVLTPVGLSGIAEPSPGVAFDVPILVFGSLATVVLIAVLAAVPAWRSARTRAAGPRPASFVASSLGRAGAPVSAVAGVRLALEPGRGRSAVPLRTATLGVGIGVAALVIAVTFADSLNRLIDTPRYSGYTWDVAMFTGSPERLQRVLSGAPAVEASGRGGSLNFSVGGRDVLAFVWDSPSLAPVIADGRAPRTEREVALGPQTMRALHLGIGDSVSVKSLSACAQQCATTSKGKVATMTVVGRAILPGFFSYSQKPGEGIALTLAAALKLFPEGVAQGQDMGFLVRYRHGTDIEAATKQINDAAGGFFSVTRQRSGDLEAISHVSHFPYVLAEMIALFALTMMLHALLTSIRRRARDLAILKTLGFVNRQVRAAVAWQASVIGLIALAVSLPLGVIIARWVWRLFAEQLSVLPRPVVHLSTVLWLIPITLLLANLIAAFPARAAARTQPALVLRTE